MITENSAESGRAFAEYADYDGIGLAELVRKREVSAHDLVASALLAIERVNPKLNALTQVYAKEALIEADRADPDAPFAGVPFLVKDLTIQMAGKRSDSGSRLAQGIVATQDTELMRRFRRAGVIPIGKTTTPEFGANVVTESALTGATRSPWSLGHTPGGSSGGSTAAIAAGVVPLAHGNDGLGSIRIPAANCHLFGLKPTRQRTPSGPSLGELSGGRGVEFVMSRSVRDSAAMLDCVHGMDPGAPHCAPPPHQPFVRALDRPPPQLRIHVMTRTFSGAPVDPECEANVLAAARLCEDLGHHVSEASLDIGWDRFYPALITGACAGGAPGIVAAAEATGRAVTRDMLEPFTWFLYEAGLEISAFDYFRATGEWARVQRLVGVYFETCDLLLTPMLVRPPAAIGELSADPGSLSAGWHDFGGDGYSPFAGLFNVTGQPAASIPFGFSGDGLPLGIHVAGRFGDEATILAFARQIETARSWHETRPPIHYSASRP
ncbi:MAG: amidase [Sphingomonas sp.]